MSYEYVDYEALDPVKKLAMEIFEPTLHYPEGLGLSIDPESLGGTAIVVDFPGIPTTDFMLADNLEGLGTKIDIPVTILKKIKELSQKLEIAEFYKDSRYFRTIGTDNVRMSENDTAATGAVPFLYIDLVACGDSTFYKEDDMEKISHILWGMRDAADEGRFAIPAGETPELRDVIFPDTLDLAGCSLGLIRPKSRYLSQKKIVAGDKIYGISTPGPNSNGIGKIREIAKALRDSYFTKLDDGRTLGEAVLVPTPGYSRPTSDCLDEGVDIHFAQPITGHAWEKIARAMRPFTYEIENIPESLLLFRQLIEFAKSIDGIDVSNEKNYKTWNMGIGWVLIAPESEESKISRIFGKYGMSTYGLGTVKPGERMVDMKPFGFQYRP